MHLGASHESLERPSWEQIEDAVRQMDGHGRCEVSLVVDDETYLMLGGGAGGRFVCEVVGPWGDCALSDPAQPEGPPVPVNDGQPSLYDPRHVIGLAAVLQAARHFATKGEPTPSYAWGKH